MEAELQEVEQQMSELQKKKVQLRGRQDSLLQLLDTCGPGPGRSSSRASRPEPGLSQKELQRFDGTGT